MSDKKMVTIEGEIQRTTDQAYFFSDGTTTGWVPKSLVEERDGTDDDVDLLIPEWLAIRNGFV